MIEGSTPDFAGLRVPGAVAAQIGRAPREPWRVGASCEYGHATVIVSPSTLLDGTLFPTYAWLTCPWLTDAIATEESGGGASQWAARAASDEAIAAELRAADAALREARRVESGGVDACPGVGLAGQGDPLKVKCLHAHMALELLGIEDPIGRTLLSRIERVCPDRRCDTLSSPGQVGRAR